MSNIKGMTWFAIGVMVLIVALILCGPLVGIRLPAPQVTFK